MHVMTRESLKVFETCARKSISVESAVKKTGCQRAGHVLRHWAGEGVKATYPTRPSDETRCCFWPVRIYRSGRDWTVTNDHSKPDQAADRRSDLDYCLCWNKWLCEPFVRTFGGRTNQVHSRNSVGLKSVISKWEKMKENVSRFSYTREDMITLSCTEVTYIYMYVQIMTMNLVSIYRTCLSVFCIFCRVHFTFIYTTKVRQKPELTIIWPQNLPSLDELTFDPGEVTAGSRSVT